MKFKNLNESTNFYEYMKRAKELFEPLGWKVQQFDNTKNFTSFLVTNNSERVTAKISIRNSSVPLIAVQPFFFFADDINDVLKSLRNLSKVDSDKLRELSTDIKNDSETFKITVKTFG